MRRLITLLLCGVISLSFADTEIADESDAAAEVRCSEIAFSQSVENRDLDTFGSMIDEDARFVGNSAVRGRANIVEAWSVFFQTDGPELIWRPQFTEVLSGGDLALSRGPYRMRGRDEDGNTFEEWGTFNSVWRRNDNGNWHVIFDAGNASADSREELLVQLIEENAGNCM
jgi:ketosteroid isomerase-like protein